ncbi:hypothetical protein BB559_000851, partial [Furculomyces boomerangus]
DFDFDGNWDGIGLDLNWIWTLIELVLNTDFDSVVLNYYRTCIELRLDLNMYVLPVYRLNYGCECTLRNCQLRLYYYNIGSAFSTTAGAENKELVLFDI